MKKPAAPPFIGLVKNGHMPDGVRKQMAIALACLEGEVAVVRIRKHRAQRSNRQNSRYWALLTVGAISLWEDPSQSEALHEEIAHLLLALPPCEKTGIRRRQRTPKMNTKEFAEYTDRVAMKLVELGADLSAWDEETERQAAA